MNIAGEWVCVNQSHRNVSPGVLFAIFDRKMFGDRRNQHYYDDNRKNDGTSDNKDCLLYFGVYFHPSEYHKNKPGVPDCPVFCNLFTCVE
jgi:hypothetical protein